MTIYRTSENAEAVLINKPESGLGYQVIRYNNKVFIVFNAIIAITLEKLQTQKFSSEEYALLSGNDPDEKACANLEKLSLDNEREVEFFSQFGQSEQPDTFGLSFLKTVVEPPEAAIPSNTPQSYYRYSAYSNDRRVDEHGNFKKGSYATTYADMHFVPSGFAAVGRYALPNPASAQYVFQIVTKDRPDLIGTATPNFGQAGGGVEVFFSQGASNDGGCFSINVG